MAPLNYLYSTFMYSIFIYSNPKPPTLCRFVNLLTTRIVSNLFCNFGPRALVFFLILGHFSTNSNQQYISLIMLSW